MAYFVWSLLSYRYYIFLFIVDSKKLHLVLMRNKLAMRNSVMVPVKKTKQRNKTTKKRRKKNRNINHLDQYTFTINNGVLT